MKIITLNTWGGRAGLKLIKDFVEKYRDADVFCFQEIWQAKDRSLMQLEDPRLVPELLGYISEGLSEFNLYFRPQYRNIYGLATFVRKTIIVEDEGERFVFKEQGYENPASLGNHGRNIQYVTLKTETGLITVVNFHGLWNGSGKTDTDDRIQQSTKISEFIKTVKNLCVLVGDFNLNPETESFRILKEICPRDLIKEFGVTSTRSSYYPKPGKFADYVLTSAQIKVSSFEVLPDEVSDHLALRVDIDEKAP